MLFDKTHSRRTQEWQGGSGCHGTTVWRQAGKIFAGGSSLGDVDAALKGVQNGQRGLKKWPKKEGGRVRKGPENR